MLRRTPNTPWVRDALRGDPLDAMAVESLLMTTPFDGTVRLSAKSAHGPFLAIVNTGASGYDGYRGTGATVSGALARAIRVAEAMA